MIRRYHVVQEFNKGVYDYIIASDENSGKGEQDSEESDGAEEGDNDECKPIIIPLHSTD